MRLKVFPWKLWNLSISGPLNCSGPIKITDNISKSFGINFCNVGNLVIGGKILIGENVTINQNVFIVGGPDRGVTIGNNVLIGPNVVIRSSDHKFADPSVPIRNQGQSHGVIIIDDDVWLGANVVVTKNVRIGRGSVIGAGSVVTKDIPEYSVAVGVPAKVVGTRT
jgi:galactoside O-acetyltransferase